MLLYFVVYFGIKGGVYVHMSNDIVQMDWVDYLSIIGSIFSVIGVGITIYLAISTQNIKEKVKVISNIEVLKKEKKALVNDLKSCQDLLEKDEKRGISDLSRIIRQLDEYKGLMSKEDLGNLKTLKKSIHNPIKRDVEQIIICINALIGFLELNTNNNIKHI